MGRSAGVPRAWRIERVAPGRTGWSRIVARNGDRVPTHAQREAFDRYGLARLTGAIPRAAAEGMSVRIWDALAERDGVARGASETWRNLRPAGLQALTKAGAFATMASEQVRSALDELLADWQQPFCWGQPLVTFPRADGRWEVPHGEWHIDLFVISGNALPCVKLLALLTDVEPRGGGSLIVTGSHRLAMQLAAERGVACDPLRSADLRTRLERRSPWFQALWSREGGDARGRQLMEEGACVDGIDLRVIEVSGKAGDVFVMHPYALHAASPNVRREPRMMLGQQVNRRGTAALS